MPKEKEVKTENFATLEEALAGAGTTVLSHLGESRTRFLTREEVDKHDEEMNPKEAYAAYAGPYTRMTDDRNTWTFRQEAGEIEKTRERVEAYQEYLKGLSEGYEKAAEGSEDGKTPRY